MFVIFTNSLLLSTAKWWYAVTSYCPSCNSSKIAKPSSLVCALTQSGGGIRSIHSMPGEHSKCLHTSTVASLTASFHNETLTLRSYVFTSQKPVFSLQPASPHSTQALISSVPQIPSIQVGARL